jgi:hypothetical protein
MNKELEEQRQRDMKWDEMMKHQKRVIELLVNQERFILFTINPDFPPQTIGVQVSKDLAKKIMELDA